ncbi:MAG TPA: hypothetical protein VFS36_13415 [Chitinophagaceae bacterium]|jgi:hypothetical protein|nr:hypothetical protein [Chitinophagaceae bacterium]
MDRIKAFFSEKNMVVVLFVLVFLTFSFAKRQSQSLDKLYLGFRVRQAKAAAGTVSIEKVFVLPARESRSKNN